MSTTEQNKQLVDRFIQELFSQGDLGAIDRYLAPGFVNHDPPFAGAAPGVEGFRQAATLFREAFPDWHSTVEQYVAEGDVVVERFTASGTHEGSLLGADGTGRTVSLRGVNIFRIEGDLIVERWGRLDDLGLLQQLGLVPAPAIV